ncbi:coiled-coil domain-containing protein 57-like [Tubulanus polymorphus]|uniref:coiled-coil domain-containing protein 57-like n=1 Tax=Tubulanus polymorphus TaxID=672921 RepID=UPI003DA4645D
MEHSYDQINEESLKQLADQKEQEWKQLQQMRTQTLEAAFREKEKLYVEEHNRFIKLKEDFKYNLKLLEDRDKELDKYDVLFNDIKAKMSEKDAEISELKIKIDELNVTISREIQEKSDVQTRYQQRIKEKQLELEQYRTNKDNEIDVERAELESYKREINRRMLELEQELEIQKHELNAGFDDVLRKREHEFRLKVDDLSSQCLSYEIKVKLLTKELELVKNTEMKNAEEIEAIGNNHCELEKKLKQKEWELQDTSAIKDAKIAELEGKIHHSELTVKRMKEEYCRKHEELDKFAREKDVAVKVLKDSSEDRERSLQDTIRQLQSKVEGLEIENRRLQWTNQDSMQVKEKSIERLQEELSDMKLRWDQQLVDQARSRVNLDVDLQQLKEENETLKGELLQRKEDLERYRKDLNLAIERQASLEREKAQLELDWQKRFEDIDRHQYDKAEDLVQNLTKMRDEAKSELKVVRRDLEHREDMIRTLTHDRDVALTTLQQHGLSVDQNVVLESLQFIPRSVEQQIVELQEQNENLVSVIRQMRTDMEDLGGQLPSNQADGDRIRTENGRTDELEKKLNSMKSENEALEQKLRDRQRIPAAVSPISNTDVFNEIGDNLLVRTHVQSLNEMIGVLRGEKVDLSAQVKKQQAKIFHLENMVSQLSKQPREKQVEVEQLQYELGAQQRRGQTENSSLRHRLGEIELELAETRKEADEYFRSNLEQNTEVTALRNEISDLKMKLAAKNPSINFGAQELVIQQLEDELSRLRHRHGLHSAAAGGSGTAAQNTVVQLQDKLRSAAKHIHQLAKEKQQLIEISNRMRSELVRAGIPLPTSQPTKEPDAPVRRYQFTTPAVKDNSTDVGLMKQRFESKLGQLEKLQYELTKQELAFAQKKQPLTQVSVDVASSSDVDDIPGILKHSKYRSRSDDATKRFGETQRTSSPAATMDPLQLTLSSVGGESIQDVWKMLDDGQSIFTSRGEPSHTAVPVESKLRAPVESQPRVLTQNIGSGSSSGTIQWTVKGRPSRLEEKQSSKQRVSDKTLGKLRKTKPKIRNYNAKD